MMAYCTTADVRSILDNVDGLRRDYEATLDEQIALAQYEIDAELQAAGVTTPLADAPPFVRLAAANLAAYIAVRRVNTTGAFSDIMREFREQADKYLRRFADGLAIPPQGALPRDNAVVPRVVNPHAR